MHKYVAIVLWLSLTLVYAQSAQRPAAAATAAHKRPNAPPANLSDAEIQRNINAKLAKSKIGKNGFKFTTSGGTTTIEGRTDIIQHKGSATRIANSSGSRKVINRIIISDAAKKKAQDNLASGRRRAQVTRSDPRSQAR